MPVLPGDLVLAMVWRGYFSVRPTGIRKCVPSPAAASGYAVSTAEDLAVET